MAENSTPAPVPAAELVAYETHEERVQAMERDGFIYFPAVLGEDCHLIQMTQWNTGGREEQGMHTDWKPIHLPADVAADPRVHIPALIVTAHFYLDDIYAAWCSRRTTISRDSSLSSTTRTAPGPAAGRCFSSVRNSLSPSTGFTRYPAHRSL
jgi:hypothetical protein